MKNILSIIAISLMVSACSSAAQFTTAAGQFASDAMDAVDPLPVYLDQSRALDASTDFGNWLSPRPFQLSNLPSGDDGFSSGFRDGCETTLNFGVGMLRTHPFAYDIDRGLKDKNYYAGYRAGTAYCVYYADTDPL